MALIVAGLKDGKYEMNAISQTEIPSDAGVQHFPANLPIEQGDVIGVVVYPGGALGMRDHHGASIVQSQPMLEGGYRKLPAGPRQELLVRADYVPGASVVLPPQLNGTEAANAPAGNTVRTWVLRRPTGIGVVRLVRIQGVVAFDYLVGRTRVARVVLKDALADGRDIGSTARVYPYSVDADGAEAGLDWLNPDGIEVTHYFGILPRSFDFYS
jgi:hypothetical protein